MHECIKKEIVNANVGKEIEGEATWKKQKKITPC